MNFSKRYVYSLLLKGLGYPSIMVSLRSCLLRRGHGAVLAPGLLDILLVHLPQVAGVRDTARDVRREQLLRVSQRADLRFVVGDVCDGRQL